MNILDKLASFRAGMLAAALLGLSACATAPGPNGVNDPLEGLNRTTHAFNKGLDTVALRPASKVYDAVLPDPVENGVSNFAGNLSLPGKIINNLLQARFYDAGQNTARFVLNSTFGIGGLFDPASELGATEVDTDFGETLHVWGAGEGAYVELPFFGPSNTRDTVGLVVDILMDPVSQVLKSPHTEIRTGSRVGEILQTRHSLGFQVDGVLYESEDSYAQARLLYLQNRRFALGGNETEDNFIDPYEDPYIDPYADLE